MLDDRTDNPEARETLDRTMLALDGYDCVVAAAEKLRKPGNTFGKMFDAAWSCMPTFIGAMFVIAEETVDHLVKKEKRRW